jgi:hypothetical protein
MLTVKKGVEDTFLVYSDHALTGLISLKPYHKDKPLYQAISKNGQVLGESEIYGEALALIVGKPFTRI